MDLEHSNSHPGRCSLPRRRLLQPPRGVVPPVSSRYPPMTAVARRPGRPRWPHRTAQGHWTLACQHDATSLDFVALPVALAKRVTVKERLKSPAARGPPAAPRSSVPGLTAASAIPGENQRIALPLHLLTRVVGCVSSPLSQRLEAAVDCRQTPQPRVFLVSAGLATRPSHWQLASQPHSCSMGLPCRPTFGVRSSHGRSKSDHHRH